MKSLLSANAGVLSLGIVAALVMGGTSTPAAAPALVDAAAVGVSPLPVAPQVVATPAPARTAAPSRVPAPRTTTAAPAPAPAATAPATRTPPTGLMRAGGTGATRDLDLYRGLGTWVDAYDFAPEFGGRLTPATVDQMAAAGIRTIYLQAAKEDRRSPGLLVRPDLVRQWVARAHAHGIKVQAWYLPKLQDLARDEAHLAALLAFRVNGRGFDSIGLDIEARNVSDLKVRNARLIALSRKLRASAPHMSLSGIVLAPVHTDLISPTFWPDFPWAELRSSFDVWQTMGYWTDRKKSSPYSDSYRQTVTNVVLLRKHLGDDILIHPIGGIGVSTAPEVQGYIRAVRETGVMGGSLYDWVTTPYAAYAYLRTLPS